jgi:RNA polymerase sigma factor (sigma-70 family)
VELAHTTIIVQRFLDDLDCAKGDAPDPALVRQLLGRAANRLHLLAGRLLYQSYPRLVKGPCNLRSEELLGAVVERMIKAMRSVRPRTVREFFALANQHLRWELNDIARRFDKETRPIELRESLVRWPVQSDEDDAGESQQLRRILAAFDELPKDEREAFDLVRLQGLSTAEAAVVIGVSDKTVGRRLKRCLLLLTHHLADLAPAVV